MTFRLNEFRWRVDHNPSYCHIISGKFVIQYKVLLVVGILFQLALWPAALYINIYIYINWLPIYFNLGELYKCPTSLLWISTSCSLKHQNTTIQYDKNNSFPHKLPLITILAHTFTPTELIFTFGKRNHYLRSNYIIGTNFDFDLLNHLSLNYISPAIYWKLFDK